MVPFQRIILFLCVFNLVTVLDFDIESKCHTQNSCIYDKCSKGATSVYGQYYELISSHTSPFVDYNRVLDLLLLLYMFEVFLLFTCSIDKIIFIFNVYVDLARSRSKLFLGTNLNPTLKLLSSSSHPSYMAVVYKSTGINIGLTGHPGHHYNKLWTPWRVT